MSLTLRLENQPFYCSYAIRYDKQAKPFIKLVLEWQAAVPHWRKT